MATRNVIEPIRCVLVAAAWWTAFVGTVGCGGDAAKDGAGGGAGGSEAGAGGGGRAGDATNGGSSGATGAAGAGGAGAAGTGGSSSNVGGSGGSAGAAVGGSGGGTAGQPAVGGAGGTAGATAGAPGAGGAAGSAKPFTIMVWDGETAKAGSVFWTHNGISRDNVKISSDVSHSPTKSWLVGVSPSEYSGVGFGWGDVNTGAGIAYDITKATFVGFWFKVVGTLGGITFQLRSPHPGNETGGTSAEYAIRDGFDGQWHEVKIPVSMFPDEGQFTKKTIIGFEFHCDGAPNGAQVYLDDWGYDLPK